jgi:hypothetical protein
MVCAVFPSSQEISSCGCLNTADVVYPAFPQLLYLDPELLRLMQVRGSTPARPSIHLS